MTFPELDIRLHADVGEAAALVSILEDFAAATAISGDALFRIQLALDELIVNVINYGYPDREPGDVSVRLRHCGDHVEITVSDDAVLFDPLKVPTPEIESGVEQRALGGLGVHLVRSIMDEVIYSVRDGRNHTWMCLALDQPGALTRSDDPTSPP